MFHDFIVKLQNLPEDKKKAVFFTVVAVATLIIGGFGIISTKNNISKLNRSLKSINLPSMELPQIGEERADVFDTKELEGINTSIEELNKQINESGATENYENFSDTGMNQDIFEEFSQIPDNSADNEINSLDQDMQGF